MVSGKYAIKALNVAMAVSLRLKTKLPNHTVLMPFYFWFAAKVDPRE